MPLDNVLALVAFHAVLALALLVLLWPEPKKGVAVLRRWGVAEPDERQTEVALRYLRRRRLWYPVLMFGIPLLSEVLGLPEAGDAGQAWLLPVLLGGLLGEVVAQRPVRGPRREASLERRGVSDLVPVWAVVLHGLLLGWLLVVRALPVGPSFSPPGVALGSAFVAALAGWGVVLLAVRKPPEGDWAVDAALRLRSARVALGLAIAVAGVACAGPGNMIGQAEWTDLLLYPALIGWYLVVRPVRVGERVR
ncbi:hypothetical protein [Actinosynnema pretiosum]|uniref:Uncharacterized protein n=1 Tax=Actinosynnema pretiosum TaxID=42197 RepID=A0A290Z555_9PSEU|nr:hypothetical protein [Actinosynnema pretiosum]ATE54128.1 hypothetical protein CNX65_13195 [Actinosynnema pretiosum]